VPATASRQLFYQVVKIVPKSTQFYMLALDYIADLRLQ
jgi:hypothetical protein